MLIEMTKGQQQHWAIYQIKSWRVLGQHTRNFDLIFLNKSETEYVTKSSSLRIYFKLHILVILAKFAFDGSNMSVMPRTFSGSFRSISAVAVNLT